MKIRYFVITAVLATAILGFGASKIQAADAQSASDCMLPTEGGVTAQIDCLQRFISRLMVQLQTLQAQQGTATTWCHTFNTNLGIGSAGDEVYNLRVALCRQDVLVKNCADMGGGNNFDESIASAVSAFQQKYASEVLTPLGLKYPTGYVGPSTRKKLNALYGCGITTQCPSMPLCEFGGPINTGKVDSYGCTVYTCPTTSTITINSVSGPNSLNVSQTGTWTVNASAPAGTTLTYSVDWGDIYYPLKAAPTTTVTQTATFTHAYSQAGTYTITFTVADTSGHSAQSTLTVVVGTAQPSITVTSPNGGETYKKGDTVYIRWYTYNISSTSKLDIDAIKTDGGVLGIATLVNPFTGNQVDAIGPAWSWAIPTDTSPGGYRIDPGQYKIRISITEQPSIIDMSNNYFTITQ